MDRGFKAAVSRVASARRRMPRPARSSARLARPSCRALAGPAGRSGAVAFRRAGQQLGEATEIDGPALADALDGAVQAMQKLGGAQPGDKTMIDALVPAVEALRASVEGGRSLPDALTAACDGCRGRPRRPRFRCRRARGGPRTWASAASGTRTQVPHRPCSSCARWNP